MKLKFARSIKRSKGSKFTPKIFAVDTLVGTGFDCVTNIRTVGTGTPVFNPHLTTCLKILNSVFLQEKLLKGSNPSMILVERK